jgi:hypothetical protein
MASKLYRFKFPTLFLSIESENVWPSTMDTFAVLHVEKDDQVRQYNNNKVSSGFNSLSGAVSEILGKHKSHNNPESIIFVKQVKISHNYGVLIFVLMLCLVFNTPLHVVYFFCTILTPSKIIAAYHPLARRALRF